MPILPVPEFRVPLLKLLGDGKEWKLGEAACTLADVFKLTPEERELKISSGYPVVRHRTTGARFHMRKAGLVEGDRRDDPACGEICGIGFALGRSAIALGSRTAFTFRRQVG